MQLSEQIHNIHGDNYCECEYKLMVDVSLVAGRIVIEVFTSSSSSSTMTTSLGRHHIYVAEDYTANDHRDELDVYHATINAGLMSYLVYTLPDDIKHIEVHELI
jgi:hypothetical protein